MFIDIIINEIKNKIVGKFPFLNIYVKKIESEDECFVLIDDKDIYNTDDFLDIISDIQLNILFPRQIGNIYISYRLDNENYSKNFYQIYSAPNYSNYSLSTSYKRIEHLNNYVDTIETSGIKYLANTHKNIVVKNSILSDGVIDQWIMPKSQTQMDYDLAA